MKHPTPNLIAAAPEMLEALKMSLDRFKKLMGAGRLVMPTKDLEQIENAIKKAEGN